MASTALATTELRGRRIARREEDGDFELTFKDVNELYAFLSREMMLRKIKYNKFAEKADMCAATVSRMAHGETHFPRFQTVFYMLKVLGYEMVVRG